MDLVPRTNHPSTHPTLSALDNPLKHTSKAGHTMSCLPDVAQCNGNAAAMEMPICSIEIPEKREVMEMRMEGEKLLESQEPTDHLQAINLLLEAADNGSAPACFRLGLACAKSQGGLKRDEALAAELYAVGTKRGNPDSCFALGCCYECGRGVPKNLEMALECWNRGATKGHKYATFMHNYASGNVETAACDLGFVQFLIRNKKAKNNSMSEASLHLYAGVLRRRCLYS